MKTTAILGITFALATSLVLGQNGKPAPENTDDTQDGVAAAILKDASKNNPAEAVKEYEKIIDQFDAQRPAAAQALFRLGESYRKLGRHEEAKDCFARLAREFSDQKALVRASAKYVSPAAPGHPKVDAAMANHYGRPATPAPTTDTIGHGGTPSAHPPSGDVIPKEMASMLSRLIAQGKQLEQQQRELTRAQKELDRAIKEGKPQEELDRLERMVQDRSKKLEETAEKMGEAGEKMGEVSERFGENFGKQMEKWGEAFGKQMEQFGKSLEKQMQSLEKTSDLKPAQDSDEPSALPPTPTPDEPLEKKDGPKSE